MATEVYMPKMGMTMKEGTIVGWLKMEGEFVKAGEPLAEITSEKITNVIDAPADGFLEKILVPEGDTVPVGTVIAYLAQQVAEAAGTVAAVEQPGDKAILHPCGDKPEVKSIRDIKPLSGLRKVIGERMSESLRRSPQGTMTTRADMSALLAYKEKLAVGGQKVSLTDLFVKIMAAALETNPVLNSTIEDGKLVLYKSANIGVAVGTEEGLFVPVVKNAEEKSIARISQELKEFTQKIKEKRLSPEDMAGGTFTVSNLGMFDVDVITPIINPPEAAILAIGATRKEVVVLEDGTTAVRPLTTLSLTADHAVMDGLPAVQFLATVKQIMNNPQVYLG